MIDANGTCLCGGVTWEAKIDPDKIAICHCTQCQVNGSSAFQWAAIINMRDLSLNSDSLKSFVKTAESGNQREINFCENCGTTIFGAMSITTKPSHYALADALSVTSWLQNLKSGVTRHKAGAMV